MMDKQHLNFAAAFYYYQFNGNGQLPLFSEQAECEWLKDLLSLVRDKFHADVLGYCLLHDSIHLILKTGPDGCFAIGDWLLDSYTEHFNQRHQRHGSVIHSDYTCTLLEPQHYLLPAIRQLHNLPVDAGLVPHAAVYPWSSHRDYLSPTPPSWLACEEILRRVTLHRGSRMRRYEHYVELGTQTPIDWIQGNHENYYALASDTYIHQMLNQTNEPSRVDQLDLPQLIQWVCQETGLAENDLYLWRRHRLGYEVRAIVAALAEDMGIAHQEEVAEHFGSDIDSLNSGVRGLRAQRDLYLFKLKAQLEHYRAGLAAMGAPADLGATDVTEQAYPEATSNIMTLAEPPTLVDQHVPDDSTATEFTPHEKSFFPTQPHALSNRLG